MSPRPPSTASYARALERLLARVRGRPVLLSPRDFRYVANWHARGVPLGIVCEAIEAAAAPRRRPSLRPRVVTLAYVAPAVEEGWGVVLSGRTLAPSPGPIRPPDRDAIRRSWVAAAERAGPGSALARLLTQAVRSLDEGAPAAAIDRALDEELVEAAPSAMVTAMESVIGNDLKGHGARMTPAGLSATRRRALLDRLRRSLELPRLSRGAPSV